MASAELKSNCPVCNNNDKSYKVSVLYMEGLDWQKEHGVNHQGKLNNIMDEYLPEKADRSVKELFVSRLITLLSPPAGKKQYFRAIHPDNMAGFFLIISLIILIRANQSQPKATPIIIALLAISLIVFVIVRRHLLESYNQKKIFAQHEVTIVEKSISKWMRMYYCARDQCIFDPLSGQYTTLDQLNGFFRQD